MWGSPYFLFSPAAPPSAVLLRHIRTPHPVVKSHRTTFHFPQAANSICAILPLLFGGRHFPLFTLGDPALITAGGGTARNRTWVSVLCSNGGRHTPLFHIAQPELHRCTAPHPAPCCGARHLRRRRSGFLICRPLPLAPLPSSATGGGRVAPPCQGSRPGSLIPV